MTTSFYVPLSRISSDLVMFPDEEAHHAIRVLRHRLGDVVRVVDGAGTAYRVRLTKVEAGQVTGEVEERIQEDNEPPYRLTIAAGILKKRARFETFVEKAVELGASELVPLSTVRTEKSNYRTDRVRSIAEAAMKQSGRCRLPTIREATSFDEFLGRDDFQLRLIAHETQLRGTSGVDVLHDLPGKSVAFLVGPEGGFDEDEIMRAVGAGYAPIYFGARRLRGETAAIFAAALCHSEVLLNQDVEK